MNGLRKRGIIEAEDITNEGIEGELHSLTIKAQERLENVGEPSALFGGDTNPLLVMRFALNDEKLRQLREKTRRKKWGV